MADDHDDNILSTSPPTPLVMASFTIEEITILSDPFINASVGKLNNLKYENV